MPRTHFIWHLFASWCALLAAVLAGCSWLTSVELARLSDSAQFRRMSDVAAGLTKILPVIGNTVDPEAFATLAREITQTALVGIDLLEPSGAILAEISTTTLNAESAAHWPTGGDTIVSEARAGRIGHTSRYDPVTGKRMLAVCVPLGPIEKPLAIVRVLANTTEQDRELFRSQRTILIGYLALALAAAAAGYGLAKRTARPVQELAAAVTRLAGGAFETPIPTPELAELSSLAAAIGLLREQLVERGLTIGRQGSQQEAVLGSMIEGVLAIDARQRIVSMNLAAADLLGLDPSIVMHRPLQEVVPNPDLRRFALRAIDCSQPLEDDLLLRGLRDRTIRVRGTALRDLSGDGGAVIVLNDVTDIQHLENVRRDFVANVSHELKTPIASIKGFVETLLDGAADNPVDNQRFLTIIAKQAERLEAIIEDLLALSRIEQSEGERSLPVERVRLADLLAAVMTDCLPRAIERSIGLQLSCPDALEAEMNAPLLEQAMINLVDNAIKYSEPGKTVWLTAAHAEHAGVGMDEVRVSVRDEGCGIEASHLPRLFERFYRVDRARSRKLGGTGLGLSIVKHIMQAHGGSVTVESSPGIGSTFTIQLPAC